MLNNMCVLMNFTKYTLRCFNIICSHRLILKDVCCPHKINYSGFDFMNNIRESHLHTSPCFLKSEDVQNKSDPNTIAKPQKKKKVILNYVTLIGPNNELTVTTLEDANKLAARRDLKLVKVKDCETSIFKDRPTYQLLTAAQYLRDEKKSKVKSGEHKSSFKGVKLLSVSSKINDHDINSKINNIMRWLEKQNEVRIAISNDNGEAENVYNKIAEKVKDSGRFVQKREKGSEIRFQIIPLKKDTTNDSTSES